MSVNKKTKMIVVVDDDPDILSTLRLALEKEGYRVATAESAVALLTKLPPMGPELILLDVMLPWVSGYDICHILKSKFDNCPIIMISGRSQRADVERGFWSGADEYFTKPLDLDVLLEKVQELTANTPAP